MYIYGLNILSDKLRALNRRSECSRIPVLKAPQIWTRMKGTPRPAETYRGARRNAPRELRRVQLWRKRNGKM